MKNFLLGILLLTALVARAANPSFSDFNTTQFGIAGNKVAITNGASITNLFVKTRATVDNLSISNWPAGGGIEYQAGPGSDTTPVTIGNGLAISSGILNNQWSSIVPDTNSNAGMGLGGLVLTKPKKDALITLTTNNYAIDMTSGGPGYYMVGTNSTINISFANVPTDTNSIAGPWTVIITNTLVTDESLIMNWSPGGDFIGKVDPTIKGTNETTLYFWYWKGYIRGDFTGPTLRDDQHTLTTITATSAVTNYVADFGRPRFLIVAANDVFFLNSTNRSVDTTVWQNMEGTIRASGANRRVDLNSNWHLAPGTTTPVTITNGTEATIRLWDNGASETNVTVQVIYAVPFNNLTSTQKRFSTFTTGSDATAPFWANDRRWSRFYHTDLNMSLNTDSITEFSGGTFGRTYGATGNDTLTNFCTLQSSLSATNDFYIWKGSVGNVIFGGAYWHFLAIVKTDSNLPSAAQDYLVDIGFTDETSNADPVDAVCFRLPSNASGAGAFWQIWTRSNSTGNPTTTTTAVAFSTWYTLEIFVNAAGTSAEFWINGTQVNVSPLSSNIPTGTARVANIEVSHRGVSMSTARKFDTDLVDVEYALDAER